MSIVFENPLGFWALLALPTIVAIHFFQQRAQKRVVSVLFLIEKLAPDSRRGTSLERFLFSRAFWLQIFAAFLSVWLLVQPRWIQKESRQTVAIVLDASASMLAFRGGAIEKLTPTMKMLAQGAGRTRWIISESHLSGVCLYIAWCRKYATI